MHEIFFHLLIIILFFTDIETPSDPCNPSICGPNSICKVHNEQAICSCMRDYHGSPPNCRPECVISAECPTDKACIGQKCVNPCNGQCGVNTKCLVVNHSPICSCLEHFTGDAFSRCYPIQNIPEKQINPCLPSPCGPFSKCRDANGVPSCICLENYVGAPPNCRPECVINSDCPSDLACIRQKCKDPCPGSCGINAQCIVKNHMPICRCYENFIGDAFIECKIQGKRLIKIETYIIYKITFLYN